MFEGEIRANNGNFGDMHILSSETWGDSGLEGTKMYDDNIRHTLRLYSDFFTMFARATNNDGVEEIKESIRISPYHYPDRYDMKGIIELYAQKGESAINVKQGQFHGLRHDVMSTLDSSVELSRFSPYVIILNTDTTDINNIREVYLPIDAEVGSTYHIINAYRSPLRVGIYSDKAIVFNVESGNLSIVTGWNDGANNPYKIEAYFDGNLWYICPIK